MSGKPNSGREYWEDRVRRNLQTPTALKLAEDERDNFKALYHRDHARCGELVDAIERAVGLLPFTRVGDKPEAYGAPSTRAGAILRAALRQGGHIEDTTEADSA